MYECNISNVYIHASIHGETRSQGDDWVPNRPPPLPPQATQRSHNDTLSPYTFKHWQIDTLTCIDTLIHMYIDTYIQTFAVREVSYRRNAVHELHLASLYTHESHVQDEMRLSNFAHDCSLQRKQSETKVYQLKVITFTFKFKSFSSFFLYLIIYVIFIPSFIFVSCGAFHLQPSTFLPCALQLLAFSFYKFHIQTSV